VHRGEGSPGLLCDPDPGSLLPGGGRSHAVGTCAELEPGQRAGGALGLGQVLLPSQWDLSVLWSVPSSLVMVDEDKGLPSM
jgi:hypothetical protein